SPPCSATCRWRGGRPLRPSHHTVESTTNCTCVSPIGARTSVIVRCQRRLACQSRNPALSPAECCSISWMGDWRRRRGRGDEAPARPVDPEPDADAGARGERVGGIVGWYLRNLSRPWRTCETPC